MICHHCRRDIMAYQDRVYVTNGGYVHNDCYPAYRREMEYQPHSWKSTVLAVLIIVGIVVAVWWLDKAGQ